MSPSKRRQRFSDQDYRDILTYRSHLRHFLAWSEGQARAAGLTPAQHQLLLAVRGHDGDERPSVTDIAGHLGLQHHSAVGLIARAEAAGLVRRVPDGHDRRVVRIALEPAGEAALEHLTALHVIELRVLAEMSEAFRPPVPLAVVSER